MAPAKTSKKPGSIIKRPISKYIRLKPHNDGKKKNNRKMSAKPMKLRNSITPGTILILLSGSQRGKRCICLGQLKSGLLLVTGPFKVNGVPLRRVNHRYVIATSTKINISNVNITKYQDEYFGKSKQQKNKEKSQKSKEDQSMFMQQGQNTKQGLPQERKADQDAVDQSIIEQISKDKLLTQYLKTKFSLRNNTIPHMLKF